MRVSNPALLSLLLLSVGCDAFAVTCQRNTRRTVFDQTSALYMSSKPFVNNGPFDFLVDFLEVGGIEEGKKITWGVIPQDIEEEISDDEALLRRRIAAANLTNIDDEERARRAAVGDLLFKVSIVYASYLAIIADDGGIGGHFLRFTLFPLFSLAYGYKKSAEAGLWDVDGRGISKIENPDLARALLFKVNVFNAETAIKSAVAITTFAAIPKSAAILVCFLSYIYALDGKIPDEV